MNRGAVVGFLVLAALVGGTASLQDQHLTAFGERLLAIQSEIDAHSTYQSLARLQTANARLAFLELDDYAGWDTPAYNYVEPQSSWDFDVPGNQEMYGPPAPAFQSFQQDSWNFDVPSDIQLYNPSDPDGYGVLVAPNGQPYPIGWSDPDNYGVVVAPSGTPYPDIDLSWGAATRGAYAPTVYETITYQPAVYEAITYAPAMYETISYTPTTYVIGGATGAYEPAWYERAFPGWGTAAIALLPSQYRPDYGSDRYVPYLSVQPTYYDRAEYDQSAARNRPSCTISLADSSIDYGGTAVITWSSQYATSASLNGVGTVSLSGTRSLPNQTASRTIGVTVTGPGGTGACYAALSVNSQQPPSCQISINPTKIKKGETANLAWVSTNATEAALAGFGTVPVQSGRVVSPSADTTFTLSVKNAANRTATCSVKIDVQ